MARARKCDRCKKLYEPYNQNTKNGINAIKTVLIDEKDNHFLMDKYDLCSDCCKEFNKWLKDSAMVVVASPSKAFIKSFEEDG